MLVTQSRTNHKFAGGNGRILPCPPVLIIFAGLFSSDLLIGN
jgi:hypothetical protein